MPDSGYILYSFFFKSQSNFSSFCKFFQIFLKDIQGTFYRLRSPFETDFCAWELVAEDRKRAWAMFAFRAVSPHPAVQYLRLRGLDPDTRYTVVQLGITACGSVLMNAGIPVSQPFEDYAALAFDLIAES